MGSRRRGVFGQSVVVGQPAAAQAAPKALCHDVSECRPVCGVSPLHIMQPWPATPGTLSRPPAVSWKGALQKGDLRWALTCWQGERHTCECDPAPELVNAAKLHIPYETAFQVSTVTNAVRGTCKYLKKHKGNQPWCGQSCFKLQ